MIELEERRALVCAPLGRDAALACHAMTAAGIACEVCKSWPELMKELNKGAGLILAVEEILTPEAAIAFTHYLTLQPTWSDVPVLVLTKSGVISPWLKDAYESFGNLTLLERPVRVPTLVSAAKSALRARLRQYEIRDSDQRKDEFLAMLAHELRNPLAPVSSAAQILKLVSGDPKKVLSTVEIIDRQVMHLTNLIDDLLDVARVTRGLIKLEKVPQDMRTLLAHAIEQVTPHINAKHQTLKVDMPTSPVNVLGDSNRLIQVIVNILNNASKYTPNEGNISIAFRTTTEDVMLDINDDGIGIAEDLISHIFELFAQAKRTSDRSQGGLGLGLALVKSLVISHGGNVSVTSKGLGEGSQFSVCLPRLTSEVVNGSPVMQAPAKYLPVLFQSLRLMVVDDNKDAADSLAIFLEAAGHEVFTEYTATDAIARARLVCPHICILDIGLPDMDGNELASQLRAMQETENAIFIAVTGYGQMEDRGKSLAAGFHYHFVKPVDPVSLINVIAEQGAQHPGYSSTH